jgi:hypothetical protein
LLSLIKSDTDYKEVGNKLINEKWLEKSGLVESLRNEGKGIRWTNPDRVEERKLDGFEEVFEVDKDKKTMRKLVNRSGSILMARNK